MEGRILRMLVRQFSTQVKIPKHEWRFAKVCVVGSGPAGFYTAQHLMKTNKYLKVDILERYPVPYGLVRYGVAPDHPEVKNVINTFEKIALNPDCTFLGNVNVGKDVTIEELKNCYNAVVLAYGAEEDRELNIPGENLNNVLSARRIVGWYNGLPEDKNYKINLNTEEAVIIGQGNVAIDVARILLSPVDRLRYTDITPYALEELSRSKIRKVWLVGRRGPLQAAFTIAELRELTKLNGCKTNWRKNDFVGIPEVVPNLIRPRKRLTELMLSSLEKSENGDSKKFRSFNPIFKRGPLEFLGSVNNNVTGVKLSVNKLVGDDILKQSAEMTDKIEEISCGLAIRSIGYKSKPIENNIPFDHKNGRIINKGGKIGDQLYASGWAATGPAGVILSTMSNAFQVAAMINKDLETFEDKPGGEELLKILFKRGVNIVSFENWKKIDEEENRRGKYANKSKEKIVNVKEMLKVAFS